MKKALTVVILTIVILGIIFAVIGFGGKDKGETATEQSTITEISETAIQVIESVSETETVTEVPQSSRPIQTTATAPSTAATAPSTAAPSTTAPSTAAPSTTQAPTTTTTTVPSTQAQSKAVYVESVQSKLRSGNYTMTISAFGEDKNPNDKLIKTVSGGKTAFWFAVPDANMAFKVFTDGDKYYLATETKYCELTKSQYDICCATFNKGMFDFSGLTYQKTEAVRDGFTKYTCEYFTANGATYIVWFSDGELIKLEASMNGVSQSLPMTVSSSVNSNYFSLGADLEQVEYETLKAYMDLAGLFFG